MPDQTRRFNLGTNWIKIDNTGSAIYLMQGFDCEICYLSDTDTQVPANVNAIPLTSDDFPYQDLTVSDNDYAIWARRSGGNEGNVVLGVVA